jgi:transposase
MRELNKLKQELLIMKTNNIKPNYAELARIHNCDYRTVKKYDNGYEGKPTTREKESKLDKYKEEIKSKLELPGSTIKGTYEFFKEKDNNIGNYSNFYKYSIKNDIKPKKNNSFHPRYETEYGKQLQFDWKEEIKMVNKYGEMFEFNIFSSTLGASRLHVFIYSKYRTRIDVQRCLVKTFQYIGGLPEEILTDNMSSIVDTKKKEFYKEFKEFSKDIGFIPKKCKPKKPYTKGKDESCNRFISWLIPYNGEFETEEELIKIIEEINLKVNKQINETIGVPPIMLFQKEKEYLKPLPSNKILNSYLYDTISAKVSNEALFYYKGSKYSVPIKFINHTVSLREENNKLYVYYNKELITIHESSLNYINYKEEHYNEGLRNILKNQEQEEIDLIVRKNLELINKLSEV